MPGKLNVFLSSFFLGEMRNSGFVLFLNICLAYVFIARQHAVCDILSNSVRPVLCLNECMYHHIFQSLVGGGIIIVFSNPTLLQNSKGTPSVGGGALNTTGWGK